MKNVFHFCCVIAVSMACIACLPPSSRAETAIPLLGGFDTERIASVYPPIDDEASGELAKLIYRLGKVDPSSIATIAAKPSDNVNLGDAWQASGTITKISIIKVPNRLHEFLELTELQLIVAEQDDQEIRIVTAEFPRRAKAGDKFAGPGVVIEKNDSGNTTVIAASRIKWFPSSPKNVGWKLLSEAGLDVGLIAAANSRNRKPLAGEDGDAFYCMLSAAHRIQSIATPDAVQLAPVDLLQSPQDFGGQRIQMELETAQITRISVTEPTRQNQLQSNHYFQIDAMGDLKNVVIKIESPDPDGPPVTFENRYPVSLVVRELPDFLRQKIRAREGGDAVTSDVRVMIAVDGFFYRLWSYSTDFMKQHGGGNQFGPLVVAARIHNREPTNDDPAGVGAIGWIAAIAVLLGILAIWAWGRRTAAVDRELSQRRKDRQAEHIQLP